MNTNDMIKKVFCKDDESAMKEIISSLNNNETVEVNNVYETIYGTIFETWLHEGLKNTPCTIKVVGYDKFYGYPNKYVVTPTC